MFVSRSVTRVLASQEFNLHNGTNLFLYDQNVQYNNCN